MAGLGLDNRTLEMLREGIWRTNGRVGAGLREALRNLERTPATDLTSEQIPRGLAVGTGGPGANVMGFAADSQTSARIPGLPAPRRGVLDYNDMLVRNPNLRDALSRLRRGMDLEGYVDVPLIVTGGESYYDPESGKSYSLSNGSIVEGRSEGSFHNVDKGARDVDIRSVGIPEEVFEDILRQHTPFERWDGRYDDGHWHLSLPNTMDCPEGVCVR